MQGKISIDLVFCNSRENFFFDELVTKVADAFEHKAIAELLKLILGLIQEVLLSRIFAGQTVCHKCTDGNLVLNGGHNRRIRAMSYPKTHLWAKFLFLRRKETILAGIFIGRDLCKKARLRSLRELRRGIFC